MSKNLRLKNISNHALDENLKELVVGEREILAEIILHIREVHLRKMYLSFGYPSLFEYLTKRMGYANGSAQRRIDAARLSSEVPEVIDHLESGKINLSQITILAQAMRQGASAESKTDSIETDRDLSLSFETKEQLISDLCDKSVQETQKLVSQALNISIQEATKVRSQKDESVRLEITFSKAQWQKLIKARELLSHSLPDGSWDQVFEYLSEQIILKKDKTLVKKMKEKIKPEKTKSQEQQVKNVKTKPQQEAMPIENRQLKNIKTDQPNVVLKQNLRKAIPIAIQREVFQRDLCCQYEDQRTRHKCSSTWQLTLDHIQPVWAGGNNNASNLRVLCANHNHEIYRQQNNVKCV